MRFPDAYSLRRQVSRETIIFSAGQLPGKPQLQEDYFLNFNDECFVLADGVGRLPHGEIAAKLACETSIWGYKHIRQHPYYWLDKKLFMKRIFRSTNLAVWQKRREKGFEGGLATTLLVLMMGAKNYWIGHAGNSSAWLYSGGIITKLTRDDTDAKGKLLKAVGFARLGLFPQFISGLFGSGDVMLLTTDGVGDYLTEKDMKKHFAACTDTMESVSSAVTGMLACAFDNGSDENMSAVMIKRLGIGA